MIWLYRVLYWPIFVLLLPKYLSRLASRGGKWHLGERCGYIHPPTKKTGVKRLWIQAVSVGELNSLRPLLTALKENPGVEVVLSITTTTARKLAEEKFAGLYVYMFTFPLDNCSGRVMERLKPDQLLLVDSELWPELLYGAQKRRIPVVLINARLSDRSYKRMQFLSGPTRWILKKLSLILTSTPQDTEKFLSLGANPELVYETGNLKFDTTHGTNMTDAQRAELLKSLGWNDKDIIAVGASTWAGEEIALLNAYKEIKAQVPHLKLLIVPRHAERRAEVEAVIKNSGLVYHRRTAGQVKGSPEVVLADTTGELALLVKLAAVVFVGKSLRPHTQGQSPIDAAAAGKPVLMGPGMSTFKNISETLVAAGGGKFVGGPQELKEELRYLLTHEKERAAMGAAALAWYEKNRGATQRVLEYLELNAPVTAQEL